MGRYNHIVRGELSLHSHAAGSRFSALNDRLVNGANVNARPPAVHGLRSRHARFQAGPLDLNGARFHDQVFLQIGGERIRQLPIPARQLHVLGLRTDVKGIYEAVKE